MATAGFQPVAIAPANAIRHAFYAHPGGKILLIQFSGTYGLGSAGNLDAAYMLAQCEAAFAYFEPLAVIYDFSSLAYEWGDRMESVLYAGGDMPWAVITSDLCQPAIRSLLALDDEARPARHIAASLESAMQLLAAQGQKGLFPGLPCEGMW